MIVCCKCKIEKNDSEFALDPTCKNGRSCTCKECKRKYQKEYRKRPDAIEKRKKYMEEYNNKKNTHKEEIKEFEHLLCEISKRIRKFEYIVNREIKKTIKGMQDYYNYPIIYKQCSKCGKIKDIDCFEIEKYNNNGIAKHRSQCETCREPIRIKSKKNRKNNTAYIEKQKEYNKTPQRKASNRYHGSKRRLIKHNIKESFSSDDILFVFNQFGNKCFNCDSYDNLHIDHHYPLSRGHALTRNNAVLLCSTCNIKKHNKLPEEYYSFTKLMELAIIYDKIH